MPPPRWLVCRPVMHFLGGWLMWEGPGHRWWCYPWAGGPESYKRADQQAKERKPGSSYTPAMASAVGPASRFLRWVSALSSWSDDANDLRTVSWTNPFLSSCFQSQSFITVQWLESNIFGFGFLTFEIQKLISVLGISQSGKENVKFLLKVLRVTWADMTMYGEPRYACKDNNIINHILTNAMELWSYLFIFLFYTWSLDSLFLSFCSSVSLFLPLSLPPLFLLILLLLFFLSITFFRIGNHHFQLVISDCHRDIAGSSGWLQSFMSPLIFLVTGMTMSRMIPSLEDKVALYHSFCSLEHHWT